MINTELLGALPNEHETDPVLEHALEQALENLEAAADENPGLAVAWARRALEIEPACSEALLFLADNAPTAVERIVLLKEVIATHKRQVRQDPDKEIQSAYHPGAREIVAALALLSDELPSVGDHDGARRCRRLIAVIDEDDRFGAGVRHEGGLRPK